MHLPNERFIKAAQLFRQRAFSEFKAEPASDGEIRQAEQELGHRFPTSYRWFQKEFGNFSGAVPDVYTVRVLPEPLANIVSITRSEQNECFPKLPPHLIAFSDEGADAYCFDTSRHVGEECPIVLWDHESDEHQTPIVVAASFLDWLEDKLNERQWFTV